MEKKTIGKLISVLRKANGMTQQELGDKLFVSGKTVSRWENDEYAPEISLLPAIAEIFGITTDELLRGERNNPERENYGTEETKAKQKAKSEKQFDLMLDKKSKKYTALTCVSASITVIGVLIALLFRIFYGWGLGLTLTAVFVVAAEVCQIVFAIDTFIKPNEDNANLEKVISFNERVLNVSAWFGILNLTIPIYSMLTLRQTVVHSLGYGTFPGLAAVQFVFLYIIYALVIRKALVKRGLIVSGEVDAQANLYNTKLLKKMILICGIIAGVLSGVLHIFISPHFYYNMFTATYNTVEEFKEHYESEYDEWCNEQKEYYWIKNEQGGLVFDQEAYDDYCALRKDVGYLEDANGHAYEYYALSGSITGLTYERQGNKIWNIQVFDMDDTYACVQLVKDCFGFVFVLYFGVCAVIYKSKTDKNKKKVLAGADENKAEKPEFEELAAE